MSVSFILSCRNDGYGGIVPNVENPTMKALEIACRSIKNIDSGAEIIIVEWCPLSERKTISEILSINGIRVISVNKDLQEILDNDWNDGSGIFYEYIAKDIGAKRATYDNLIFTNADDIFISNLYEESVKSIEQGKLVRATRCDLKRNVLEECVDDVLEKTKNRTIKIIGRSHTAAGDFIGIKKDLYFKINGFLQKHGIWDIDNEFVNRAQASGIESLYVYEHYHIEHERNHILGPWGGRAIDSQDIDPKILETVDNYCSEIKI